MRKPTLFIGCSKENLNEANALHQALTYDAEPTIWDQGTFRPSDYPLESLETAVERSDFAAFIFVPDDKTVMRGEQLSTVRDNVVFELGLAIGRLGRKRTFIIVPMGQDIHIPTDLKGWTPIEFDPSREDGNLRSAMAPVASELREAFAQVGLRPRASLPAVVDEPEEAEPIQPVDWWAEYLKPDPDWNFERLRHVLGVAITLERSAELAALEEFFKTSQFASDNERIAEWEGTLDEERLQRGQSIPLMGFKERARKFPENQILQHQLADALSHYGDHGAAMDVLEKAARRSSTVASRGHALVRAASEARSAGAGVSLRSYLAILSEVSQEAGGEVDPLLLGSLRDIADHFGLNDIKSALGEALVQLQPDDTSLRFDLAFGYADANRNDLAVLHYEGIPEAQRSAGAWNNLGVAYSNLMAPGLAVQNYRAALEKGASVAAGNLANKLINAGFYEQARDLADKALAMPDHDENVDKILPSIHEAKAKEQESADSTLASGRVQQSYMRSLGRAATSLAAKPVEGQWETPECRVLLEYLSAEEVYVAKGDYVEKTDRVGLGLGLFGPTPSNRQMTVEYRLQRIGDAFEGTVKCEARDGSAVSLLGIGNFPRQITMLLAEGGAKLIAKERGPNVPEEVWIKSEG